MSNWASTKYKTTDWSAYNKTLKRRGPRSIRFEPDTTWAPPPSGKRAAVLIQRRCNPDVPDDKNGIGFATPTNDSLRLIPRFVRPGKRGAALFRSQDTRVALEKWCQVALLRLKHMQ